MNWPFKPQPLTRGEFLALFAERARELLGDRLIEIDETKMVAHLDPGLVLSLANCFHYCSEVERSQRRQVIDHFITALTIKSESEADLDWQQARSRVFPRIRDRVCVDELLLGDGWADNIKFTKLNEVLFVETHLDCGDKSQSVNSKTAAAWGTTWEDLNAVALDNLRGAKVECRTFGGRVYMLGDQDGLASSQLLLWDRVSNLKVAGRHVALIPNSSTLLITGSEDSEGLEIALSLATKIAGSVRSLALVPFVLSGTDWLPFKLDDPQIRELWDRDWSWRIQSQTETLVRYSQRTRQEVVVVGAMSRPDADGRLERACTVTEVGCPSWLPEVDLILLACIEGQRIYKATMPWNEFARVPGVLLKPLGHYPDRFELLSVPSRGEFEAKGIRFES